MGTLRKVFRDFPCLMLMGLGILFMPWPLNETILYPIVSWVYFIFYLYFTFEAAKEEIEREINDS